MSEMTESQTKPLTKPLPEYDLRGILDAVAVLAAELTSGGVPPVFAAKLTRQLAKDGLLMETTSVGEFGAYAVDLTRKLKYALGEVEELPQPVPRRTTYLLSMPTASAARNAEVLLAPDGGTNVIVRQRGDGSGWDLLVDFPDLSPDPSYHGRVIQLTAVARMHGGSYAGFLQQAL